jgi:hypothetical protein
MERGGVGVGKEVVGVGEVREEGWGVKAWVEEAGRGEGVGEVRRS